MGVLAVAAEAPALRPAKGTAYHTHSPNCTHKLTSHRHTAAVFALFPSVSVCVARRYESAELYWRLFDASVPVKHLVFNKVRGATSGTGTAASSANAGAAAATGACTGTGRSTPCHGILWWHVPCNSVTANLQFQSPCMMPLACSQPGAVRVGSCLTCAPPGCHVVGVCLASAGGPWRVCDRLAWQLHT